jgi:hypothetical protein
VLKVRIFNMSDMYAWKIHVYAWFSVWVMWKYCCVYYIILLLLWMG